MRPVLFLIAVTAFAADTDIAALIPRVADYDFGKDPEAVRQLEAIVLSKAGSSGALDLEKQVLAGLAAAKTLAAKDAFCRNLSVIGSPASVPALRLLLAKAETVEAARYALERIPGDEATGALRAALSQNTTAAQAGIVASLGRRKDAASVAAIARLLASGDAAVSSAAAGALAQIGGRSATAALMGYAKTMGSAKTSPAIADSLLRAAAGMRPEPAAGIYRMLNAADQPETIRIAALIGLARVEGSQAVPALVAAAAGGKPRMTQVAIRELARLDPAKLQSEFDRFAPPGQVQALAALADSGRAEAVPLLEKNLSSVNASIRVASLNGLAKLGTPRQIPMLAAKAAESSGDEQVAARSALACVRGADADASILNAIPGASSKTRAELIRAAGDRGIRGAPVVLLKTATDADAGVRAASIRALRETASPADAPAILGLLAKTQDENERKEYERAAASAIRRSKDAPVDAVTAAYGATTDPEIRASLLSVLASVGNNTALPVVRDALKAGDEDLRRAALNAFAAWPSPAPMLDLLALAKESGAQAEQALSLRGYVKLVQIPSDRTPAETAKLLAEGMAAARRPEERRLVIAAAQRVVCPESLELVKSVVGDPAVAREANLAVTVLERGLAYRRN